jgi:hypothetical protein
VDAAHFFYGGFRYQPGALEQLTQEAVTLVRHELSDGWEKRSA